MIKFHFLNVGHGDCKLIEFTDSSHAMIVDINTCSEFEEDTKAEIIEEALGSVDNTFKSFYKLGVYDYSQLLEKAGYDIKLQDPIQYLKDNNIKSVFRFISTHPHMDHISGLSQLMNNFNVWNFWVLPNTHTQVEKELTDSQKEDWNLYKEFRDCNEDKLNSTTIVRPRSGSSLDFWKQDGITILSPNEDLIKLAKEKNNPNIMSYVILIEYGGRKFVLGGDAEKETWEYIVDNYSEEIKDITILDASHHGRDSGYYQPALDIMKPDYVIVSVGKKPDTDASNKYRNYSKNVWSTRWKGNITFEINSDGSSKYNTQFDR